MRCLNVSSCIPAPHAGSTSILWSSENLTQASTASRSVTTLETIGCVLERSQSFSHTLREPRLLAMLSRCEREIRGRVHVSDSVYESPYNYVYDLHSNGLGFQLSFGHQLQPLVNTFQGKSSENLIANHFVREIVHGIVRRFKSRITSVDGP
jgi:hypothetical protein